MLETIKRFWQWRANYRHKITMENAAEVRIPALDIAGHIKEIQTP